MSQRTSPSERSLTYMPHRSTPSVRTLTYLVPRNMSVCAH